MEAAAAPRWSAGSSNRKRQDEQFPAKGCWLEPRAAIEQELGSRLPESVEVKGVEGSADTIYLVLPSASVVGEGGELLDLDLQAVAGGQASLG